VFLPFLRLSAMDDLDALACAFVESYGEEIHKATRSASFRGEAFARRALEASTMAAALSRGEPVEPGPRFVTDGAWGRGRLRARRCGADVEMTEHAIVVPESGAILAWVWHSPGPATSPKNQ
jgi:hypothetical protein